MRDFAKQVFCTIAAIALSAGLPTCAVVAAEAEDVSAALEEIRTKHKQPAMVAAVISSERLIALGAAGVREDGKPDLIAVADRFHVGSCTKAITATMIATLVEEGKIDWQTTLGEVFDDFESMNPAFAKVTVEQLLTHRAGVPSFTAGASAEFMHTTNLTGTPQEQRREFARRVLAGKPIHEPGSKMVYSNGGYGIAAAIAEKVSDSSWEDLLRNRIFKPLGMDSAGFGWPARGDALDQPRGHWAHGSQLKAHWPNDDYELPPCLAAAGNVHCSVEDFSKFAQIHLKGLRGQTEFLKPESFQKLHTLGLDNYAMGWIENDRPDGQHTCWHNGSAGTFFAWMTLWLKSDLAIVVITNAGNGEPACQAATEALFRRFAQSSAPAATQPSN